MCYWVFLMNVFIHLCKKLLLQLNQHKENKMFIKKVFKMSLF